MYAEDMRCPTTLWRYNHISGYWHRVGNYATANADRYLKIFQDDEPGVAFLLSNMKPRVAPASHLLPKVA